MRKYLFLILGMTMAVSAVQARDSDWGKRLDTQLLGLALNDAAGQTIVDAGLFLTASYLDRREIAVGAAWIRVTDNGGGATDYNSLYLSGREHFYSDRPAGRFTLRLDGYALNSTDPAVTAGEGSVVMPILSFGNRSGTWSAELGYARSRYTGLKVGQWSPAFGFAPSWGEWLQVRAYLSHYSNPAQAQDLSDSSAFDLTWSHVCVAGSCLGAGRVWFTVKGGERIYAVDPAVASVANRAEVMTNGLSLGASWRIRPGTRLILAGGGQQYEDRTAATRYAGTFAYIDISHEW